MKLNVNQRIYTTGILLLLMTSLLGACSGEEPLYRVRNGHVFQFVDRDGEVILETEGLLRTRFSEELVPFLLNLEEGFGYMDTGGNIVIPAEFDRTLGFSEGFAAVLVGDKWGFINKQGEIVVEPQYASVDSYSDGLALVQKIEEQGNKLGQYGFINTKGDQVIEYSFDYASSFSNGSAAAVREGQGGFINKNGEFDRLLPAGIFAYGPISIGLAPAADWERYQKNELSKPFGFIDIDGNWVIEPRFDETRGFVDGRAAVNFRQDGWDFWGYVDRDGEMVIDAVYQFADDFYEGLAYVSSQTNVDATLSGWIDTEGEWVFVDE